MIKKELPEIDLSRPPPPSPTDDPILLRARLRPSIPTHARETPQLESSPRGPGKQASPLNRSALDFPLPGIPSDVEDNEDFNIHDKPVFDLTGAAVDTWSSSDEGDAEQEGEFTGKFREVCVPTKTDPPTSATRERIEQWGRPVSPFPRKMGAILEGDAHSDIEENSIIDLPPAQPLISDEQKGAEEVPVPETNGNPGQPEHSADAAQETEDYPLADGLADENRVTPPIPTEAARCDQEGDAECKVTEGSPPPVIPQEDVEVARDENEYLGQDANTRTEESRQTDAEVDTLNTLQDDFLQDDFCSTQVHCDFPSEPAGEEQTEEDCVEHVLSEGPQPITSPRHEPRLALEERIEADEPMHETADGDSEGGSSDESDLSVVKIVSDDPWAAARAAAILKQVCSCFGPLVSSSHFSFGV